MSVLSWSSSRTGSTLTWRGRWFANNQGGEANNVKAKVHWFTLTFRDPTQESEFCKAARESLPHSLFVVSLVCFGITCAGLGFSLLWETWDASVWDDYHPGAALDQVFVLTGAGSLALFNIVTLKLMRPIVTWLPFRVLEIYMVFCTLVMIVASVLVQPHYIGRLKGYPVPEVADDTNLLLLLTIVAMCAQQNNHVRWHMMIPALIFCVLGYTVPALLLGPDPWARVLLFSVELAGLIIGASNSSRLLEIHERAQFLNLLEEKTRRVQSEFQLSRIMHTHEVSPVAPAGNGDARSNVESVPTTTESGQIFEINRDADQRWDGLLTLGRQEQWLLEGEGLSWRAEDVLGAGSFGIVVKGYYQGIGVAVKVPRAPPQSRRNKSQLMEACNELQILRRLRHPNVVSFYGAWVDERHNDLALVLELVNGVALRSYIHACPSNQNRSEVIAQISCALFYLHNCHPRVVHGDLKDSNIFIESRKGNTVAKLLDFGLARRITKRARPMGGTLLWVAPEVVQNTCSTPDTAADVFSFGRLVYFIVTGNVPGEGVTADALRMDLMTGVLPTMVWPEEEFAGEYRTWADNCNQAMPAARPQIQDLRDAFMDIWQRYGISTHPWRHRMDPDLHKEVQALRNAVGNGRSKRNKSDGQHVRGFTLAGPSTRRFSLEGMPEDSSSSRAASDATTRLYPGFELTSVNAQTALIAPALARCNFGIDNGACCHFHAAVQNLRNLVNLLSTKRCGVLAMAALAQCKSCGAMLTEDDVSLGGHSGVAPSAQQCDLCGEAVPVTGVSIRRQ